MHTGFKNDVHIFMYVCMYSSQRVFSVMHVLVVFYTFPCVRPVYVNRPRQREGNIKKTNRSPRDKKQVNNKIYEKNG